MLAEFAYNVLAKSITEAHKDVYLLIHAIVTKENSFRNINA